MPGEDLHRHDRPRPEAGQPGVRFPASRRWREKQGCPDHRAKVGQMARVDVREIRSAKHEQHAREHARQRMQTASARPEEHEPSRQKNVQRDADVDRASQRQARGTASSAGRAARPGTRRSTARPNRCADSTTPDVPRAVPRNRTRANDELLGEVRVDVGKHHVARPEQHAREHRQRQQKQERRRERDFTRRGGRPARPILSEIRGGGRASIRSARGGGIELPAAGRWRYASHAAANT